MKAKKKAKELVDKMNGYTFDDCKLNALTCVEEIIKALDSDRIIYGSVYRYEENEYWQEVKQEIEKL